MKTKIVLIAIITISASLLVAQPQFPFTSASDVPVLEHGDPGTWDEGHLIWSFMFTEDDTYYLYYSSTTDPWSEPCAIGLAISDDGYNFNKWGVVPVFEPDGSGFDAESVSFPVVIKDNEDYILYYNGGSNPNATMGQNIGKATADNPEWPWEWDREEYPIIEHGSLDEWDSQGCLPESVIQTDSGLLMFYTAGHSIGHYRVGMAYFNGDNWVKHNDPLTTGHPFAESDPVLKLGDNGDWDDDHAALCSVYKTATVLEMFYTGASSDNFKIGYATSEDGIVWSKHPDPIYSYEDDPFAQENDYHVVANPTVTIIDDVYFMYFDYGLMGQDIGVATAPVIINKFNDQTVLSLKSIMNIMPNPVKEVATIQYFVNSRYKVNLSIHNINGQLISTLVNEVQQHGDQEMIFNTNNLPAGIYFCVLKTNESLQTTKMIKL